MFNFLFLLQCVNLIVHYKKTEIMEPPQNRMFYFEDTGFPFASAIYVPRVQHLPKHMG